MGRTPTHSDYGGSGYNRSRGRHTKVTSANSTSLRCKDCNKLTYRSKLELARAARPRCMDCGGTLIETEAAQEKQLGGVRERNKRNSKIDDEIARIKALAKCWACGVGYEEAAALATHLSCNRHCARTYATDGKVKRVIVDSKVVDLLVDTLHIDKPKDNVVYVMAICLVEENAFTPRFIKSFKTKYEAEAAIKDIRELGVTGGTTEPEAERKNPWLAAYPKAAEQVVQQTKE